MLRSSQTGLFWPKSSSHLNRGSSAEFNLIEAVEGELKNKFKSAITTTLSHRRIVGAKVSCVRNTAINLIAYLLCEG